MHTGNDDCVHCKQIRAAAEIVLRVTLLDWELGDIAHLAAYYHARIRFQARMQNNEAYEQEFLDFFNNMCESELQQMHLVSPLEPKSFDEEYDFRAHMKNGE